MPFPVVFPLLPLSFCVCVCNCPSLTHHKFHVCLPQAGPRNAFYLIKFWVDMDYEQLPATDMFFGTCGRYESLEDINIECSTQVC